MVVLPNGFVQINYPGYYWNVDDKKLYSCKSGVLKPMVMKKAYHGPIPGGRIIKSPPGYHISVGGIRKKLSYRWLCSIKVPNRTQIFPVLDPVIEGYIECTHTRQLWSVDMTSGHCRDCGIQLQGK